MAGTTSFSSSPWFCIHTESQTSRHRKFTAPDGKEYKWILGANRPKLITNDDSHTPVALYHRRRFGLFRAKRQAYLEVLPQAEHMLDTVVITFVYVEKIRRQKEDAAKSL
ncbi:hypothetical protein BDZ89DRAFT_1067889 [Hymenopellis radicata]|nr:hypothetical protein BDZ89DRAFT_1067889 [Hymenopellis radicata]